MAANEIQTSNDESRRLVAERIAATEIHLAPTDLQADVSEAIRLPLSHIPELGIAFASLPEMFRTVTTAVNVPTLLQATDKFGNPLDPSMLHSFNDGSGLMGSFRDAAKGFGQARFTWSRAILPQALRRCPTTPRRCS